MLAVAGVHPQVVVAVGGRAGVNAVEDRLFDVERRQWSLYWASSRNGLLALPPTVGRFGEDGVGVFTNEEEYEGKQITVRFLWSDITPTSARWEQAFSLDQGATWEPNWIAAFTRAD